MKAQPRGAVAFALNQADANGHLPQASEELSKQGFQVFDLDQAEQAR